MARYRPTPYFKSACLSKAVSKSLRGFTKDANGYKAGDAIELITKPLEDIVKAINGVEHVYSTTQDDSVVTTARFFVGTDE